MAKKKCYLAGPMRGYKDYNFDAFLEAEAGLKGLGWKVSSPARMDLDTGFDPRKSPQNKVWSHKELLPIVQRDIGAILALNPRTDALVVLPGWKKSRGAVAEVTIARWLSIPVLRYPDLEFVK